MDKFLGLHGVGHEIGFWLFEGSNPWFEFVLHTVLIAAPFALLLLIGVWLVKVIRSLIVRRRKNANAASTASAPNASTLDVFRYVLRHTRRSQFLLLVTAAIALPLLYFGLELPKLIINNAISSGHFPVEVVDTSLSQAGYLFLLCGLYLLVILVNASIKYAINVHKGRVAESLLKRLRLTIYRSWRRNNTPGDRSEVIPMLVQEIEPIGGFAGDAFVLPLFQGGTFLTILAFMLVQDPVLGAAAITLLPVQLALIPRLQRKVNELSRQRAREMRGLGGVLGREISTGWTEAGHNRKQFTGVLRRIADIRFELYRKKFFMKSLNNFINQLTPFFFYTVGGYLVIDGNLTFGALVAVLTAHKDFSAPLNELLKYYQTMADVRVRYDETRRFLEAPSSGNQALKSSRVEQRRIAPAADSRSQAASNSGRPAGTYGLVGTLGWKTFSPCAPQKPIL